MQDQTDSSTDAIQSKSSASSAPQKDLSSPRHSPAGPLAPLEYLQNQRRGSITDPSLHAAPTTSSKLNHNYRQQTDLTRPAASGASSAHHESAIKSHLSDPRPTSPYVFGDATPHSADTNSQIRKLLRSPSIEHNTARLNPALSAEDSQGSPEISSRNNGGAQGASSYRYRAPSLMHLVAPGSSKSTDSNQMNVDSDGHTQMNTIRRTSREPQQFDYNMRRHSIAVGQDAHLPPGLHGTKRKMSSDRGIFPPVGEEIDPQLVGPGVPSVIEMDTEAPAPKRRGSAIDTQRIAQLSLNDRRNSVDSRGPSQWWPNDRRESSSSMFSNVSSGFGSGFPGGDSPHGRLPASIATFTWPASSHPLDQSGPPAMQQNDGMAGLPRTFDPSTSMGMMPPLAPDRRMSVPDTLVSPGPTRVLRSRSRPPSRQLHNPETQSGPSSGQDDTASAPSPTNSGKHSKESSATPYSRSPELRVSHKLAERKRRKEMKDLFDELRDQLPADRGMKASKWEILSKGMFVRTCHRDPCPDHGNTLAIDFVAQLKQSHQDMAREIDMMRHELETVRQGGIPSFPPGGPPPHTVVYGQPPHVPGQFAPHPPGTMPPHPSRPASSQNTFSPGGGPPPAQNGNINRSEAPTT